MADYVIKFEDLKAPQSNMRISKLSICKLVNQSIC
jgi:hypothetical protein